MKIICKQCHQELNPKNKEAFYGTREEAIARGYEPCKNCNP